MQLYSQWEKICPICSYSRPSCRRPKSGKTFSRKPNYKIYFGTLMLYIINLIINRWLKRKISKIFEFQCTKTKQNKLVTHCVKSVGIRSFSGPYFSASLYFISPYLCISHIYYVFSTNVGKYGPEKLPIRHYAVTYLHFGCYKQVCFRPQTQTRFSGRRK